MTWLLLLLACRSTPEATEPPTCTSCEDSGTPDSVGTGSTGSTASTAATGRTGATAATGDTAPVPCAGCHGSGEGDALAPPADLAGRTDPTTLGVGAHEVHLSGGAFSDGDACSTCHRVPAAVGDAGHLDGDGVAEVVFSGTAVAQRHQPSWDRTLATCSDVYCHNADAQATLPDPVWTDVGSVATCDACHGAPPAAPHPNNTNCGACHSTGGDEPLTLDDLVLHVNGWLQI